MRVLWNNHRDILNPTSGGDARTIHEVSRRLVKRGHEVTVLSARVGVLKSEDELDGVRIVRYRGNLLPHLVTSVVAGGTLSPDVIVDDLSHAVPWFSPWLTSIPGVAFFRHLHARTLNGQVSPTLAGFLSAVERRYPLVYSTWPFVTESSGSEDDLVSLGIPRSRCVRIPPGVDSQVFTPRQKSELPTMVYFGGFRDYKRPEHALLVLKGLLMRGHEVRLVMIGSGPSLPTVTEQIELLGLKHSVEIRGRVPYRELADVVARAWANVHCSMNEGWGLSVMEAASAGTPTAAYKVRGISDTVKDGETGLLVPDADVELLTDAAERLLASPHEWEARCRGWALKHTWDGASTLWENCLSHAAASACSASKESG